MVRGARPTARLGRATHAAGRDRYRTDRSAVERWVQEARALSGQRPGGRRRTSRQWRNGLSLVLGLTRRHSKDHFNALNEKSSCRTNRLTVVSFYSHREFAEQSAQSDAWVWLFPERSNGGQSDLACLGSPTHVVDRRSMSGIYGWLGPLDGDPERTLASMRAHTTSPATNSTFSTIGAGFALGACGPAGTTFAGEFGSLRIALHGHPLWNDGAVRLHRPRLLRTIHTGVSRGRCPRPGFGRRRLRNRV